MEKASAINTTATRVSEGLYYVFVCVVQIYERTISVVVRMVQV